MNAEWILTLIAWIVAGFTLLQLIVAALNYIFRADYSHCIPSDQPLVSVIIPVRNEETTIGNLLDDLALQTYSNIEILLSNDDSTDKTAEIVTNKQQSNARIRLIDAGLKDEDWLGKNHACYIGSRNAAGHYLLFLDADVRLSKNAISSAIGYFQKAHVVFLSIFPRQILNNRGVYTIVPLMNYILLSLLPLFLVRKSSYVSLSAANGQFMLFDHDLYKALEPHKRFRKEKVEDIHISRYYKRKGYPIACLTGNKDVSCKMYDNYTDAQEGFSKNVFAFFGGSVTAGLTFWFFSLTGLLWMLLLPWYTLPAYLLAVITTRWFISLTSEQNSRRNILMHYIQLGALGKLMFRSIQHQRTKTYQWKGRSIT